VARQHRQSHVLTTAGMCFARVFVVASLGLRPVRPCCIFKNATRQRALRPVVRQRSVEAEPFRLSCAPQQPARQTNTVPFCLLAADWRLNFAPANFAGRARQFFFSLT
jgi:hypothetical protein